MLENSIFFRQWLTKKIKHKFLGQSDFEKIKCITNNECLEFLVFFDVSVQI